MGSDVSLGVLIDEARERLATLWLDGADPQSLVVSVAVFDAIYKSKEREFRLALIRPSLLGLTLIAKEDVAATVVDVL